MSDSAAPEQPTAVRYRERLTIPWWWWILGAGVTVLLAYELQLAAYRATWSLIFYPIVGALIAWLLWSMGRTLITVDGDGALHAHKAMLPAEVIARGAAVPASAKSAAMGRQLDPAAFLIHRSWVSTMVLLVLDDPDDPTPYWLVSTRRPTELLAALGLTDAAAQQHSS